MAWAKFFRKPGGNLGKSYQPGSMLSLAPTKGLLNEPGQNSCFLNSAVQVLWQLDIFRRSLRQLPGHFCLGESCIFCALKGIFSQFQHSRERALPSDQLRHALAETFKDEQRFQLGYMDDAAECFEYILEKIHLHIVPEESDVCTSKSCITHQKFAMSLYEQSVCHSCGASSDPLPFTELVHYVSTTVLCQQMEHRRRKSFGELLQAASTIEDIRNCPSSCGQKIRIRQVLMNSPQIVTVGFVWNSDRSEMAEKVTRLLGPHLSLSSLFYKVTDEKARKGELHLVGMICYTNSHYCAFTFHTKSSKWVFFDDATVKEIGSRWKDVISKCIKEQFQPLLLFYSNPDGSAIDADDVVTLSGSQSHYNSPVNGDAPVLESPSVAPKKLDLTRENLNALLGHGLSKQKTLSTLSRASNQTAGRRGPGKADTPDSRSRFTDVSREVAQRLREPRGVHPARREPDRSPQRRPDARYRDPGPDRIYSRSVSPPENGFKQHLDTRLYSSQGKGLLRAERTPQHGGRSSHEPPRSHPRRHGSPDAPGHGGDYHNWRIEHLSNGYDTDSSQDSRGRNGRRGEPRSRANRAWKPMREALNVDSVLSSGGGPERRQHSPRRRPSSQSPSRDRERDRDFLWGGPEEGKHKSLMTIYEDEQRHDIAGSWTSLESESRGGYGEKDRTKIPAARKVRNDTWKIQRTESGYESSDRLSNSSANLDSPVVENLSGKDLRPAPELHLPRDHFPPRRADDMKADILYSAFLTGEHGRRSPDLQDKNDFPGPLIHRRAFRYTPGILEKHEDPDSEREENVDGSPLSPGSPILPYLAKTSSSEWNSSDDFAGPLAEHDDPASHDDPFSHIRPPPLPAKTIGGGHTSLSGVHTQPAEAPNPKNDLPHLSHSTFRRWIETPAEHRLSSDASSKSGSSDQDRNDLSASESEERLPSPKSGPDDGTDSPGQTDTVLPTTYFSVDNCMTDTYRAKYHKKPALYLKAEDRASSGDSDVEGRRVPLPDVQPPEPSRSRLESGYATTKTTAKWNPVTPKGLDEHGFL
ncbi:inactive ubiquitin carboxyl-terminal hydrolase 53 isoform X2 [Antennarius striatus]|uniref:inactive ubiquitin carboxyl-terminal hydrolase 53 isoform X2 n=1 Tax=Antennarius striatus TaxID=241820 RepID=UPI0035B0688F